MKKAKSIIAGMSIALGVMTSNSATAMFFVDHEGLDKEAAAEEASRVIPDGYKVLVDKTRGIIHEVGDPSPSSIVSFGSDSSLADMLMMVLPESWIAYIDEKIVGEHSVDWDANEQLWPDTLKLIGLNNGLRFVIDWDQKLVQISPDQYFKQPDFDSPLEMIDESTGRRLFIYTTQPVSNAGVLVVGGKKVPVKISE